MHNINFLRENNIRSLELDKKDLELQKLKN